MKRDDALEFVRENPITLSIAAGALLVGLCCWCQPELASWLFLWRASRSLYEPWRLLTGHLTHLSLGHLAWDLLAFVSLGFRLESGLGSRRMLWLLVASVVLVDLSVICGFAEVDGYGGLSGISVGLLVGGGGYELCYAKERSAVLMASLLGPMMFLFYKLWFEMTTGQYPIVDEVRAVPIVHLAGALAGLAFLLCSTSKPRGTSEVRKFLIQVTPRRLR
jgi:rhomboid family GlyGly-CTERM serine protease